MKEMKGKKLNSMAVLAAVLCMSLSLTAQNNTCVKPGIPVKKESRLKQGAAVKSIGCVKEKNINPSAANSSGTENILVKDKETIKDESGNPTFRKYEPSDSKEPEKVSSPK